MVGNWRHGPTDFPPPAPPPLRCPLSFPFHSPSAGARLESRTPQEGREIMVNIGLFAGFPLFRSIAGGSPAPRRHIRFTPSFHVREGFSLRPQGASRPSPACFVFFSAGIASAKIFSNHWKMRGKFFQSLEKMGRFFQPLENFFPIIGKIGLGRRATGLCAPRGWPGGKESQGRGSPGGPVLLPGSNAGWAAEWAGCPEDKTSSAFSPCLCARFSSHAFS